MLWTATVRSGTEIWLRRAAVLSAAVRGSVNAPSNKRMKLSIVLAPAPRDTEEGHSACSPFGEHRTLAAYPRCSTDAAELPSVVGCGRESRHGAFAIADPRLDAVLHHRPCAEWRHGVADCD